MSWLERTRLLHADIEGHQKQMVQALLRQVRSDKDRIHQEHCVKAHLEAYLRSARALLDVYEDTNGTRRQELDAMVGDDAYAIFSARVAEIKQYYRDFPSAAVAASSSVRDGVMSIDAQVEFTGEEDGGKYVDMHELFEQYVNMSHFKTTSTTVAAAAVDYISYLRQFDVDLQRVPKQHKIHGDTRVDHEYNEYIRALLAYLKDFHARVHPLVSQTQVDTIVIDDFRQRWAAKSNVPGWYSSTSTTTTTTDETNDNSNGAGTTDDDENDKEEEETDKKNPLHCDACNKTFAKDTVYQVHLNGKKHKKAMQKMVSKSSEMVEAERRASEAKRLAVCEEIACTEALIHQYTRILKDTIERTIGRVEQKQTLTFEELLAERTAAEKEEAAVLLGGTTDGGGAGDDGGDESSDDEKALYNPKNVPLGWDGKPIPYWLYKLHGLNHEYVCEICGNYSYRGPRNFARHFTEARHTYGLKCLGIPNTKHFHNVTGIQDAQILYEKVKELSASKAWRPEDEEEFEDEEGNVFNKKTYEDLKRQGLL